MEIKKLPVWQQVLAGLVLALVVIAVLSFCSNDENDSQQEQNATPVTPKLVTFNTPAEVLSFFRYKDAGGIEVISESPFEVKIWQGDFWNEVGAPKNDQLLKRMLVENLYRLFFHTSLDQVKMTIYAQGKEGERLSKPGYTVSITREKALEIAKNIFQVGSLTELFEVDEFYEGQPAMNLTAQRYIELVNDPEKLNQLVTALGVTKI